MFVQRKSFGITLKLLVLAVLSNAGMPPDIFSATENFKLLTKSGQSHDGPSYDMGCKYFDVSVAIDGFGIVSLGKGVCSGWFGLPSVDSSSEERDAYFAEFEKYNHDAEQARYGVDTNTINILTAGDKAFVEWETVSQGSGLHVDHEYRVYQKSVQLPLVSRSIKTYAKSGWPWWVSEQLTVRKFTNEFISLQTDSSHYNITGSKYPLYHWDEEAQGYVSNGTLKRNVIYVFSTDSSVEVRDARIVYMHEPQDLKPDIAKYFSVSVSDLLVSERGVEINLDEERHNKLFLPVREDIPRSLFELMNVKIY